MGLRPGPESRALSLVCRCGKRVALSDSMHDFILFVLVLVCAAAIVPFGCWVVLKAELNTCPVHES